MAHGKDKAPAYQWYPKDYDNDEAVKLMSYEQEGIYRRLLDHQGLHGSIPSNPKDVAKLVPKVAQKRFLQLWPAIAEKFILTEGRLVNQKMERVRANLAKFKATKAEAGKLSADSRRLHFGTAQPNSRANDSRTQRRTQ